MARATTPIIFAIIAAAAATASSAVQMKMPSLPGTVGLPNLSHMGASNAAGVLGYCMKNDLLGGSKGASSLLSGLEKKPGVKGSKEFAAGQAGNILTGGKSSFSLAHASDPIKQQGCKMVMQQAHKFL
jgi:hypothetical protein